MLNKNINYINLIEGGKSIPPLSVIEQIAQKLNIEPHQLFIQNTNDSVFDKESFINKAVLEISEDARKTLKNLLEKI